MKKLFLITAIALTSLATKAQTDLSRLSVQAGIAESSAITNFYLPGSYTDAWNNKYRIVSTNGWKPSAVLSFRYAISKHLEVGMNLSGFSQNITYKSRDNDNKVDIQKSFYSLTATINFVYLNTDYVKMYVGGSAGMCEYTEYEEGDMQNQLVGQVTCAGLRVGKRLYGYAEVGAGCLGFVSGGIGYHFGK